MSDQTVEERTAAYVKEIIHEAFVIIEHIQWWKYNRRAKELAIIGKSLWTITQKLVFLRRI